MPKLAGNQLIQSSDDCRGKYDLVKDEVVLEIVNKNHDEERRENQLKENMEY